MPDVLPIHVRCLSPAIRVRAVAVVAASPVSVSVPIPVPTPERDHDATRQKRRGYQDKGENHSQGFHLATSGRRFAWVVRANRHVCPTHRGTICILSNVFLSPAWTVTVSLRRNAAVGGRRIDIQRPPSPWHHASAAIPSSLVPVVTRVPVVPRRPVAVDHHGWRRVDDRRCAIHDRRSRRIHDRRCRRIHHRRGRSVYDRRRECVQEDSTDDGRRRSEN
jgi:hypothetical protein